MERASTDPSARYGLGPAPGPDASAGSFPVQSSVLDERVLLERPLPAYDIPEPQACRFYCRGDADIYRVESGESVFYLKVYRPEYPTERVESEARLVTDLAGQGVPVVRPVPLRAGGFAHTVDAPEGRRAMLLFGAAPDGWVSEPDPGLCERIGAALAGLHAAMDGLAGPYDLPAVDEAGFDELLPYAEAVLDPGDYSSVKSAADKLRPHLARFSKEAPGYGLCHLDPVLSNLRLDADGHVVFFDFGTAGRGWRAYDLAILNRALGRPEDDAAEAHWNALLSGYRSLRPLPPGLDDVLPLMLLARTIGWLGGNAATLPLRLGVQPFEEDIWARAVSRVREIASGLPDSAGRTR